MSYFEAFFLGIFQGVTEFLPVSSSGHLVLLEHFFGLDESRLQSFDMILHGGTFLSLIFLFWRDIKSIIFSLVQYKKADNYNKNLIFLFLFSIIPVGFVGILIKDYMYFFRDAKIVCILFMILAFVFLIIENVAIKNNVLSKKSIIIASIFQIFALLPGISRSGIITTIFLANGIKRSEATKLSFLMGIPVLFSVLVLSFYDLYKGDLFFLEIKFAVIAFLSSFISGFFVAKFLLFFFKKYSLKVFAYYLICVSFISLYFILY